MGLFTLCQAIAKGITSREFQSCKQTIPPLNGEIDADYILPYKLVNLGIQLFFEKELWGR
jgi:hypothetical protein